jgi:NADPH:quinone reductase-like Zn-dependent oxidoreductase
VKAAIRTEYGSPDVIQIVERELPEVTPRQVRLRVEAAGVDIGVWHMLTGLPTMMRPAVGIPRPRRHGLGSEVAGIVVAKGSEVRRFDIGARVFGTGIGTFAEYAIADEKNLVELSEGVSATDAAASAISGVTAMQALDPMHSPLGRVLILGASGGVGSFAVQIAKAFDAQVTGVASTSKLDLVRALGADEVLDYTVTDPTDGSQRYDLIVDMGGNRPLSTLRRALTPDGRAVIVGGEGGGRVTGGFFRGMTSGLASAGRRQKISGLMSTTTWEALVDLDTLLAAGSLKPAIDRVYPLTETATALRRLEARQVRGKLVIDPRPVAERTRRKITNE